MKRLLPLLVLGLFAAVASAQVSYDSNAVQHGMRSRGNHDTNSNSAPPVTNPEPITLAALAGGAAVAGGLIRRRKQKQAK